MNKYPKVIPEITITRRVERFSDDLCPVQRDTIFYTATMMVDDKKVSARECVSKEMAEQANFEMEPYIENSLIAKLASSLNDRDSQYLEKTG